MSGPTVLKSTSPMPSSTHRSSPHKARTARRRRRANGFHSDDEIEREARSDSDTDDDDQSSVDSESDSETGPASEDVPHDGHPTLLSPGTTPPAIDGIKDGDDHVAPFLAATVNWSEMVADEMANGTTELPVVDFADLDASIIHTKTPRVPVPRRVPKPKRPAPHRHSSEPAAAPASSGPSPEPPISTTSPEEPTSYPEPKPTSPPAPQTGGRTARQRYQERLNDPSYVPVVGEFWSHDDRLLDKSLRTLSPWWRGRWQGGPRGRGFGPRGREQGRDRGDTNAGNNTHEVSPSPQGDVPPVDRQWTHDGYEELKRRDEQRLQRQEQSQGSNGSGRGLRGGLTARGRGVGRGQFSPRLGTTRSADSPSSMTPHTWFLIKPERPWTKHHELFLHSDSSLRPRRGQGPTYRIKLSGTRSEVIVKTSAQPPPPRARTPPHDAGNEDGKVIFTVSLPRGERKPEATESTPTPTAVAAPPSPIPTSPPEQVTDEAPVVSVPPPVPPVIAPSTTRPASPPVLRIVTEEQAEATSEPVDDPFMLRNPPPPTVIPLATPTPAQVNSTAGTPSAAVSPSVPAPISQSTSAPEGGLLWRSPPPHLQSTLMQPVPVSAPSYTSTYAYPPVSAPTLPPGVALDPHGMPYELSTGRPLYLAGPPQVHTPVYMMPYPHMHSHVQHRPHASPDPSLFAPPRQGSRIEIRRPDVPSAPEDSRLVSTQTQTHASRTSALRASASAPAFIPSLAAHEFYPSPPPDVGSAAGPAAVMGYAAYPQPPYYAYGGPEGYAYPPPQHQFVEYDAYNADPRVGGSAPAQAAYY